MRIVRRRRHWLIGALAPILIVLTLVTAGCIGGDGVRPRGSGAQPPSVATSDLPGRYSKADGALVVQMSTDTFSDPARGIRAEVPTFGTARQLTLAAGVLRDRALREAAWAGSTDTRVNWQLLAAGQGILGVLVTAQHTAADGPAGVSSAIWYDARSGRVASSPVLIEANQWGAFKNQVAQVAGAVDPIRLSRALDDAPAPQGGGPALGFAANGDLVATFPPGGAADGQLVLQVPGRAVQPLLSEVGQRALAASTNPGAFDGTGRPDAQSAPGAAAAAGGDQQQPAGNQVPRPTTTVGVDCSRATCVALTFDDGPGAGTQKILDDLAAARAPATFFQLGGMLQASPELGLRVAAAGNEIGSHTWSHQTMTSMSTSKLGQQEIGRTADEMARVYGRRPLLMRPPSGVHTKATDKVIGAAGQSLVLWNIDTRDWQTRDTAKTVAEAVKGADEAGSIVLMHDIHPSTAAATAQIIEQLRARGVTLVTVGELALNTAGFEAGQAYCYVPQTGQPTSGCK
ncbi:hypothetical protein CGZ94_18570 [Enemella evansiae]|uniref:NodB homology domain-containing protein n=1 Tax=Enemella evansiae TaxID=2016499 RepID=A0A255G5I9_9ACTN|nr:hypothetical protein CGZ94_18570 [Enemella evansiae]